MLARARRAVRALLAFTLVGLALGCSDGGSTAPTLTVAGRWYGEASIWQMNLTLVQGGSAVSGNGSINTAVESASLTASGTFSSPTVSMTLTAPGYEPMNFTGTVGRTEMVGQLNGSGFVNFAITLRRIAP